MFAFDLTVMSVAGKIGFDIGDLPFYGFVASPGAYFTGFSVVSHHGAGPAPVITN